MAQSMASTTPPPATPDIAGAMAAGYTPSMLLAAGASPTALLGAVEGTKGAPNFSGARKAGYDDATLAKAYATHFDAQAAEPVPDGSLTTAFTQGLLHGAPAGLETGLSSLIKGAGRLVGDGGGGDAVTDFLDSHAASNQAALAQNYRAPANEPSTVSEAVSGSSGPMDATKRLGTLAIRKTAENAGTLAPNLALGIALPGSGIIRAGTLGYDALQNLGGITQANQAAGIDTSKGPSIVDAANAIGQTALMGANPLGGALGATSKGILQKALAASGRVAGTAVDGAAKGAVQSVATDTGTALQGGRIAPDGVSTVEAIGSHALDAALGGAATGGSLGIAHEGAARVGQYLQDRKAGPNLQAYAQETAPWNAALQKATERVQAASPNLSPDEVSQRAYLEAQKGFIPQPATPTPASPQTPPTALPGPSTGLFGPALPGLVGADASRVPMANPSGPVPDFNSPGAVPPAKPPSFLNLSPEAQNGRAEQAAIDMYDKARQAIVTGKPNADPAPAAVFKNVLQTVTDNLKDTGDLLRKNGLLNSDQAADFKGAIEEARKHNVLGGEGGSQIGYFDTLKDKVAALPIDPAIVDTSLHMLRVADIASQASLLKNSKGPLERNAGTILGGLGAAAGAFTGGAEHAAMIGGMASHYGAALGRSTLRGLDTFMGHGVPDILQRRAAIDAFAARNGLTLNNGPQALMDINGQLRDLASTPPQGAPIRPGYSPPQGPVTASGQGYTGQPAKGPVAPFMAPNGPVPSQPIPVTAGQPMATPNRPVAQPAPAPVTPTIPGAVGAHLAINAALAAHAAKVSELAKTAFPSDGRNWSGSMADVLGVQHGPMLAAIQRNVAGQPALEQAIKGDTINPDLMRSITNHMRDLRDSGSIPKVQQAPMEPQGPVRNPLSYAANIAQEHAMAGLIKAVEPGLAPVVDAMRDPAQNGKTAEGRMKVLMAHLDTLKPAQRAQTAAILRPLAGFGKKAA